jgi:hypothetical protein
MIRYASGSWRNVPSVVSVIADASRLPAAVVSRRSDLHPKSADCFVMTLASVIESEHCSVGIFAGVVLADDIPDCGCINMSLSADSSLPDD